MPIVKECVYYGVLSSKCCTEHFHLIRRCVEQLAIPEQLPTKHHSVLEKSFLSCLYCACSASHRACIELTSISLTLTASCKSGPRDNQAAFYTNSPFSYVCFRQCFDRCSFRESQILGVCIAELICAVQ